MALTRMPYREQDDEQDPYRRESPDGAIVEPYQESEPVRSPEPATEPSRVEKQQPVKDEGSAPQAPAAAPTFKQLQEAGQARPPMPPQMLTGSQLLSKRMGPEQVAPETGLPETPTKARPPIVEPEIPVAPPIPLPPTAIIEPATATPPIIEPEVAFPPPVPELPPDAIIEPAETGLPFDGGEAIVEPAELPPGIVGGEEAIIEPNEVTPGVVDDTGGESVDPDSSVDLLSQLLAGSQDTDLEDATESAALDQLHNPSPYNSDVVKNLYADLGAGIDTDYDSRIRGLDESMARRGLYGSSGKDFHSGRLADTELGRRDAKTTLARNLATDFAKSYGDYNANAISQGQGVAGAQSGDALDWLRATLGYGQQGFENDLAVEQLNQNEDQNYQQLLQMMLAAGYGA